MYELKRTIRKETDFIFNNHESFEKAFCGGNELVCVHFNEEEMRVQMLLADGSQIVNGYKLETYFSKWRDLQS